MRRGQLHLYLDTVSRSHNKEEQVGAMDRFQAVSRRTAEIAITEPSAPQLWHSTRYQLAHYNLP